MDRSPALERLLVIGWRIHVEEAPAITVETTDLFFADSERPDSIEEGHRPQLAPGQLRFQQRQHAPAIDRMEGLEPTLPVRHDDVPGGASIDQMRNESGPQKRRIASGHEADLLGRCL